MSEGERRMKTLKQWHLGSLGEVISSVRGGFSVKCDDRRAMPHEMAVLKTSAVLNGRFVPWQNKYVPAAEHASLRASVKSGTIIFCRKNSADTIGAAALVLNDEPKIFLSDLLWELRPAIGVNPVWLINTLKSARIRKLVQIQSTGTQSTMKNISQDRLLNIPVGIPPPLEQRKIAEILQTWDEAIEKLEALRSANLSRRIWMRSHLFTGHTRLPGYTGEWREVALSEVLNEHGLKGTGAEEVFSVSVHKGLINQIEHLGRSFAAAETGHYNRVMPSDIVYTKSPTGEFPLGIIKQSKIAQEVIVSPLYGVFTPVTRALGVILDAMFESPIAARNYLHPLVQKGAKNTIAITNRRFLEGRLRLPIDPSEQSEIAKVVEVSQTELTTIEMEIDLLSRQKRGLMQKLLSGEWRVKV